MLRFTSQDKGSTMAVACCCVMLLALRTGANEQPSCNQNLSVVEDLWRKIVTSRDSRPATFQDLKRLAEKGDSRAEFYIGQCYNFGLGTKRNSQQAFEWYEKSAKGSNPQAISEIYRCYMEGIGTPKDEKRAIEWVTVAIDKELWWALVLKELEAKVNKHPEESAKVRDQIIKQAAKGSDNNDYVSLMVLERAYSEGNGVVKDEKRAQLFWERALKSMKQAGIQGDGTACYLIGWHFEFGDGGHRELDHATAVVWYERAFMLGDYKAANRLSFIYSNSELLKNESCAKKWSVIERDFSPTRATNRFCAEQAQTDDRPTEK
jgi:TPR repeat protein